MKVGVGVERWETDSRHSEVDTIGNRYLYICGVVWPDPTHTGRYRPCNVLSR